MSTILYQKASSSKISEWANETLSDAEHVQFCAAQDRNNTLMQQYEQAGLITHEIEYEQVTSAHTGMTFDVKVATKIILALGVTVLDIPIDPEWGAWEARYAADPNVDYNPTIQL